MSRTEWENESPGSISVAPLPTLLGTHSTPVLGLLLPRAETIYSEEWAQSQGKFLSLCKSKFQEALGWTPGSLPPSSCQPPPLREVGRLGLGWEQTGLPRSPFPDWVVLASPQSLAPETPASSLTRLRHIHESFLSPNVLKIKRATPGPTPPYQAAHLPPSVPLSQ